jgi:hypothetical protein
LNQDAEESSRLWGSIEPSLESQAWDALLDNMENGRLIDGAETRGDAFVTGGLALALQSSECDGKSSKASAQLFHAQSDKDFNHGLLLGFPIGGAGILDPEVGIGGDRFEWLGLGQFRPTSEGAIEWGVWKGLGRSDEEHGTEIWALERLESGVIDPGEERGRTHGLRAQGAMLD